MNLRDFLTQVPLEGDQLDLKLEINSILKEGAGRWQEVLRGGLTLVAVVGNADGEITAQVLRAMLENMPRTRVGMIAPGGVWIRGTQLPERARAGDPAHMRSLLCRMADERCTHVVLQIDDEALERREYAGLRMSVCALAGPVERRDALARLLTDSDTVVRNLDEKAWEDYGSVIPAHTFTYSENKMQADLTAKNLRLFPSHMEFEAVAVGHVQRIHLPVPGGVTLYHGLCALSCGLCLGLQWERMARVLRSVRGLPGRIEVLSVSAAYTVVLDRAQTPLALERLLTCAREFTGGRLVCVLGCPTQGDRRLREQLGAVAEQLADRIVLTQMALPGDDPMSAIGDVRAGMGGWHRPCTVEPRRERAIETALEEAGPGDVIVLTGICDPSQSGAQLPDERVYIRKVIRQHHNHREKQALTRA